LFVKSALDVGFFVTLLNNYVQLTRICLFKLTVVIFNMENVAVEQSQVELPLFDDTVRGREL